MAKKWLSVPEIAEELGINRQRVYRYISKYRIDYDKKLKNVNYYGEPIVKQIQEHFTVVDRVSDIGQKSPSDTRKKENSAQSTNIKPKESDTATRVSVQENDTAIQDNDTEEKGKTLADKGNKEDRVTVKTVIEDYRQQFEVLKQQLAQKDKQLETKDKQIGEKDEQLNKVYRLLDQQQQLELGTQKRLKTLESGNDLSEDKARVKERA
ncbi:helix-turn-helix domain-containing protein [Liquorilactobacillus mali]|uniref:helix-turn-helix domain-containing protein n=1 Tax=Liquorilactobacillus mali TaxID=1618 RepID=UPI0029534914|nr:helix-turn-helix domain-containing protein [Liquorilactobacillus mali]MDV7758831.1 helix-turn-helix domain-containing protein [Liquorilactobacillus mali]